MKRCFKCKKTKPLSEFSKSSYTKDGHGNQCRDCWRIYYAEHKEQHVAYQRQYNAKHREHLLAYSKQYYVEHKEHLLVYYKQYNTEHRDRRLAYNTEHRAEMLRQTKEWDKANYEKMLQQQHRYNRSPHGRAASKRGNHKRRAYLVDCEINDLTTPQTEVLLQEASVNCPICIKPFNNNGRKKSIDHVVPLSKEGNNTLSNIQVICLSCNSKKSNKLIIES